MQLVSAILVYWKCWFYRRNWRTLVFTIFEK